MRAECFVKMGRIVRKSPLVSVVMPVLNPHPVYFVEAVRSVLEQTLEELELVIVEDPSPRSAESLLAAFSDPRIRFERNPERTSLVDQRNLALRRAESDLVACLDADDVCEPERLQKQFDRLQSDERTTVLGGQLSIIDDTGRHVGSRHYPREHEAIVAAMRRYNPIAQPAVMFRKKAILDSGGYRYAKYLGLEDYELWCRLAQRGAQFANHPDSLVRYRVHPEGLKSAKLRGMILGTLDVKRQYWQDQMDWTSRMRMNVERILLWLPPALVLRLFMVTHYERPLRPRSGPAT